MPLPQEGFVDIDAFVFDDGSHDFCGIESFSVRRMIATCDADDINFGETVRFCCEDIGEEIMVVMRVTDINGNTNECMISVEVQDKTAPALIADLPDITVSCEFPIPSDNLDIFGTVVSNFEDRDSIILTGEYIAFSSEPFDAFVLDNCLTIISDEINSTDLNACGLGSAMRTIVVQDAQGNQITLDQSITRINVSPFTEADIDWPNNYDAVNVCNAENLDPIDLPTGFDFPVLTNIFCNQIGFSYEDSFFDFSDGNQACFKILRDWSIIDNCELINGQYVTYTHQQIIKGINTILPEIDGNCDNKTQCSYDPNCSPAFIELINSATDDCTDSINLIWTYKIDLFSDNTIDFEGNTADASGTYAIGKHRIIWTVSDHCGNEDMCMYDFELQNCKLPTAYCFDNLTADLTPMDTDNDGEVDAEMLILKPYMLDAGSEQTCGQEVTLSFSMDVTDTIRIYDCDDIGLQPVMLWVTDENGNQSFCITSIDVQDNNDVDFCDDMLTATIAGMLTSAEVIPMENVSMTINSVEDQMTDEFGTYSFADLAANLVYNVVPFKEDEAINGITTLDIVKIQKHLLGIEPFTSPYQHLAADVNDSDDVTGADLIQIRRLILGKYDEFPSSPSWRFFLNNGGFIDDNYPWANTLEESFEGIVTSNMMADFTGVKMGDVNSSAIVNGLASGEIIVRESVSLTLSHYGITAGDDVWVDFYVGQAQKSHGYQLELDFPSHVSVIDVKPLSDNQHVDFHISENGKLVSVLDYHSEAQLVDERRGLFSLKLRATEEVTDLSDMIKLRNDRIENQFYTEDLSTRSVTIESRQTTVGTTEVTDEELSFNMNQNVPNPFKNETIIEVNSDIEGLAKLRIINMNGQVILERNLTINIGSNEVQVVAEDIPTKGVLYYSIEIDGIIIMKKMLILD